MAGAALIVNPAASRVSPELVTAVERELGEVQTLVSEGPAHAVELAASACRSADRIYVLSGDGGYNEVVNGIEGHVPIGFLPGGATNVLPRALGLPRSAVECARALARSSRLRRISLGRVVFSPSVSPPAGSPAGRRFTFAAGLGLDAELVRAADRLGRRRGRRPGDAAFVWSLARLLAARRGQFEPALTVAGRGRASFALVANCDPYTYVGRLPVHVAPRARFELGLDLIAPVSLRAWRLPVVAYWVLARPGQMRAADVLYAHDTDRLAIECDVPTPLQVDGEDLGDVEEAVFEAEREALDVLVPGGHLD